MPGGAQRSADCARTTGPATWSAPRSRACAGSSRLVLDSLRDAGYEIREIRATGGFARSPLWKQMLADALAMPIGFTNTREGSAYGAALLGLGTGNPGVEIVEVVDPPN